MAIAAAGTASRGPAQRSALSAPTLPNNYVNRRLIRALETMLVTTGARYIGVLGTARLGKTVLVSALMRTSLTLQRAFPGHLLDLRPGRDRRRPETALPVTAVRAADRAASGGIPRSLLEIGPPAPAGSRATSVSAGRPS